MELHSNFSQIIFFQKLIFSNISEFLDRRKLVNKKSFCSSLTILFFQFLINKEHLASFNLQVHQLLRDQVQPDGAHPRPVGSETPRANRGDRPSEPSSSDGQNRRGHDSRGTTGPVALNERNLVAIS